MTNKVVKPINTIKTYAIVNEYNDVLYVAATRQEARSNKLLHERIIQITPYNTKYVR